jgi:hypothetical protein
MTVSGVSFERWAIEHRVCRWGPLLLWQEAEHGCRPYPSELCQYPGDPSSRLHTVDDGISPTIRPQEGATAPAGG